MLTEIKLLTIKEATTYGIAASVFTYAFGPFTGLLEVFFIAMAIDWFTGVTASVWEQKSIKALKSSKGFWGGMKKFFMILTVFFAHRIDMAFDINWLMTGTLYFWIGNELISIMENYARMNMNFPEPFKKWIDGLKGKVEGK